MKTNSYRNNNFGHKIKFSVLIRFRSAIPTFLTFQNNMADLEDMPLTNDSPDPQARTINLQTGVVISMIKVIIGMSFVILSIAFSDNWSVGGWLIMGFLGAYLLIDTAFNFIPESDVVILINNRSGSIKKMI